MQTGIGDLSANVTVTFDLGEGQRIGGGELTQTIRRGSAAVVPEIMSRPEWIFDGWDNDFDCVMSNITVKAKWLRIGAVSTNGTGRVTSQDATATAQAKF
jgi:hypothetical protein